MIQLSDSVYVDVSQSMQPISQSKTIIVFDSGMGGLTVYDEIRKKLPQHHYIYVFDNGGFPYGEKSDDVIIERVDRIISQISQYYHVDLAVIACNTASTITLPVLREHYTFPIVGVVPAIKPAVALTKNNIIGLLVTKATASRDYTKQLINDFANNVKVKVLANSELAILAENKLRGETVDLKKLKALFSDWLMGSELPDVIVLGCTHYPLLKEELSQIFPKSVTFVDSGLAIAKRVVTLLETTTEDNGTKPAKILDENIAICTQFNDHVFHLYSTALTQYELKFCQKCCLLTQMD